MSAQWLRRRARLHSTGLHIKGCAVQWAHDAAAFQTTFIHARFGMRTDVVQRENAVARVADDNLTAVDHRRMHPAFPELGQWQERAKLRLAFAHAYRYSSISVSKTDTACPMIHTP